MTQRLEVLEDISREYRRFNTTGRQIRVRLNPPTDTDTNPMDHFLDSVNDPFEHVLQDVGDADMVGIAIHNEVNQNDEPIGITFRWRDEIYVDVIWSV